jgi:hypothetical protein
MLCVSFTALAWRAGGGIRVTAGRFTAELGGMAVLRGVLPPRTACLFGVTSTLRVTSPLPNSFLGTAVPTLAMFCPLASADLGAAVTAPATLRFA